MITQENNYAFFEEGYAYFLGLAGIHEGSFEAEAYVKNVDEAIRQLLTDLNAFDGYKSRVDTLKGDIAEFWHSGTFNINAAVNRSASRTFVDRSHEFGSVDISGNFGDVFGLKYYKDGISGAKQQAKSIFERFTEYRAAGGKDDLQGFLQKRGYADDSVLNDPIYQGQVRIIPREQLEEACIWLKARIEKEALGRSEQAKRYQETLRMLQDRVSDGAGVESIPLSEMEAKRLATLAKEGSIDAKVLKQMGVSAEDLIQFEHIAKHAFKSGISASIISLVISVVPEVYRAIAFLISEGEINEEELRQIGSSAVRSSSEGFIRGVIAAALTTSCKSGVLGEALLSVSPAVIGMATVIGVDTIKNSFDVAAGRMSRMELAGELIKELIVSSNAFAAGSLAQAIIGVPVLGFMLGSFVGSIAGAFVYYSGFSVAISYCIDTGFTMFGLVEQDYMLPEDVLEAIGISVFEYEHFSATSYRPHKFFPSRFFKSNYEAESIGIHVLRRGVIGVSKIGYV